MWQFVAQHKSGAPRFGGVDVAPLPAAGAMQGAGKGKGAGKGQGAGGKGGKPGAAHGASGAGPSSGGGRGQLLMASHSTRHTTMLAGSPEDVARAYRVAMEAQAADHAQGSTAMMVDLAANQHAREPIVSECIRLYKSRACQGNRFLILREAQLET